MWDLVCSSERRTEVLASGDSLVTLRTVLGRMLLDWSVKNGPVPDLDYWLDGQGNVCEGVVLNVCDARRDEHTVRIYLRRADRWEPVETVEQESIFDEDEPF
jgi:hypothetical protein